MHPDHDLAGVVLIGGKSSRMGYPKALLTYNNELLYQYQAKKLNKICQSVYISHNSANFVLECSPFQIIEDQYGQHGPVSGILSSLEFLKQAVFIIPTDTPSLSIEVLKTLLEKRDREQICTVFYNEKSLFYEPLIGIWELSAIPVLKENILLQNYSLQKILRENNIKHIPLTDDYQFINVNSTEDFNQLL
jgi:molybdopterin-guanine dinucleotide biosynthesis protein A